MHGMVERSRVGGGAEGVGENVSVPHVEYEHFSQNIYFNAWCFTSTETTQLSRDDEGVGGGGGGANGGAWRGRGEGGANGKAWRGRGVGGGGRMEGLGGEKGGG